MIAAQSMQVAMNQPFPVVLRAHTYTQKIKENVCTKKIVLFCKRWRCLARPFDEWMVNSGGGGGDGMHRLFLILIYRFPQHFQCNFSRAAGIPCTRCIIIFVTCNGIAYRLRTPHIRTNERIRNMPHVTMPGQKCILLVVLVSLGCGSLVFSFFLCFCWRRNR